MSKLLNQYQSLKIQNSEMVYIIRCGIFYCFFNEDAIAVSKAIGLKITDLGPNIFKCGFPISQIDKYKGLLEQKGIKYQIIDNLPNSNVNDYMNNVELKKIFKKIKGLNFDKVSPMEAWNILYDLHNKISS